MADKKKQNETDARDAVSPGEELSIEEIFGRLEGIIRKLEDGEISLEDSFQYYETGMKLVKTCGGKIDKVEKQILVLNESGTEGLKQ